MVLSFDGEFEIREGRPPTDGERRVKRHVRQWVRQHPNATREECQEAMKAEYEAGSILVSLLILQAIVVIVYYLRSMPHGGEELGDDEE